MRDVTKVVFTPPAHIPGPDDPCFLVKMQGTALYRDYDRGIWVPLDRATGLTEEAAHACAAHITPWVCDVVPGR